MHQRSTSKFQAQSQVTIFVAPLPTLRATEPERPAIGRTRADPAPPPPQAARPERPAAGLSRDGEPRRTDPAGATQRQQVADVRVSEVAATPPRERRHDISRVPTPLGVAPQQDALRGAITSYDSDGRCSYAATHKCHSSHNHWSRCLVVDNPDDAEFWGDVTEEYTPTREMSRRSTPPPESANH